VTQEDPTSNAPKPVSLRQRLQECLAVPERQRTDEQWEEINELEIKLASSNRQDASPQRGRNDAPPQHARRNPPATQKHSGPGKAHHGKFHRRRPGGGAS
jgi:hypothetical protein